MSEACPDSQQETHRCYRDADPEEFMRARRDAFESSAGLPDASVVFESKNIAEEQDGDFFITAAIDEGVW